jgi:hypothetical protein
MSMVKAKQIDGKKFMWDGRKYDNEETVKNIENAYANEGFETRIVEEEGKYNIYTRRVVKEVVVDGEVTL